MRPPSSTPFHLIYFQLFWILLIFALPVVGATVDSAIGSSSDVWATLVANIAPLLILVGENHVKAYFKTMCHPSHHVLYATGPIGLITAVVTLIRLGKSHILQRLIGRQFESQAEILADLTSVSRGEVMLQLRSNRLEQSIDPEESDTAIFGVVGGIRGHGEMFFEKWRKLKSDSASASNSMSRNTALSCILMTTVRTDGTSPEDVAHIRKHQSTSFNARACDSGITKSFAAWEGVSWDMTLCKNVTSKISIRDMVRFVVSGISILAYVAIIVLNWRNQRDIQNTVLISVGLVISTAGAYFTAIVVDNATWEVTVSLEEFSPRFCGYISRGHPEGQHMPFVPKTAVMSDFNPYYDEHFKMLIPPVSILMVFGYVGLYLGLRTSEWWTSLAILGISGVASMTRALTGPAKADFQELDTNTPDNERIFPGQYGTFEDVDLLWENDSPDGIMRHEVLSYSNLSRLDTRLSCIPLSHQLSRPVCYGLAVAMTVRKMGLIPRELAEIPRLAVKNISIMYPPPPGSGPSDIAVICTDVITGIDVWRLPLDINVLVHDMEAINFNTYELAIPFSLWFRRWSEIWEYGWTTKVHDRGFPHAGPTSTTWYADESQPKDSSTNIWMAAKICMAVFRDARYEDMQFFHTQLLQQGLIEPDTTGFVEKISQFVVDQNMVVPENQLNKTKPPVEQPEMGF